MAGQGTPATALLVKRGIAHRTHPYRVAPDAPNYGALVAAALGVPPERVFKSLVTEVDGALTVAVGVALVLLGKHFPSDVLGALCVAAAWGAIGFHVLAISAARRAGR